ncbi:hypothetical protein [Lactococcus garvieae]|uniref:hypothetical protein n=1 Tax=Lactococcus garvieae TaxID=1363 RepID=UPI002551064E|nr:hypothetical protein [Lactococcus garvieae]
MKREENYVKSFKNWLIVISSTTFLVNLFYLKNLDGLWLVSFTYLSSTGLTFYNLTPKTDAAISRRKLMIEFAIAAIAITLISGIISTISIWIGIIALLLVKISFACFSVYSIFSTFMDDSDTVTEAEKKASKTTKANLKEIEDKKPYRFKDRAVKENAKTKKFVLQNRANSENQRGVK